MLSRLGFVGLWVAGSLLPGTLDLFRSPQRGWGTAVAQASEMQEQWQLLQDAQAAYQRGIQAVQRGDSTAAETAWAIASAGFRRIIKDNPQRTDLFVPLADIQIRRGQPAAAYALLIQAVRAGAKDLSVRIEVVRALQAMQGTLSGIGAISAVLALAIWWVVRREVLAPVDRLAGVAAAVADGDLSARAGSLSGGELRQLGKQVDAMTGRLGTMIEQASQQGVFLQGLVDAAPDPMVVIDEDYRIVLANQAYATLIQRPLDAVRGRPCHRIGRGLGEPCPVTLVTCPVAELKKRPEPLRTVMSMTRCDATLVSVEIHAAPLVGPDGRQLVVEAIRSLDDQVRFSQEQRLSAVGLLANGVAHEIHNPLASIRLALQSSLRGLRDGTMSGEDVTEYLVLVDKEIDRCVASTQRLLTLSHPPGETRPVDVRAAVEDTLALLEAERQTTGVSVQICLEPPGARVMADEAELRQVILNLVQNAFHAMPRGGQLRVALGREGADYHLSVSDTGVGIGADDQALVFMPFYSRRADGQQGSGLGLAICKAIVERHGGRIGVDSTPGVGSTFHVRLPAADGESP